MNQNDIIQQLQRLLVEELDLNLTSSDVHREVSLFDDGLGLDSISLAEFIELMEAQFSVVILDEDLDMNTFRSLEGVAAVIEKRRANSTEDVAV
jgi:acyl carrier protein